MLTAPWVRAAVAIAFCATATHSRADTQTAPDLRSDAWHAAARTVGALALDGVLMLTLRTNACRVCSPDALDAHARDVLRSDETASAARTSGLVANAGIPLLAMGDALRSTGDLGHAAADVLVVTEAASLASLAETGAKLGVARRRPGLPSSGPTSPAGNQSFYSGHTTLAFSVAVAQAMQDTMRHDAAAPWVWTIGLALAGSVGYLRVAGDAHWLTDVLAGAAAGTAFGVGVPLMEKHLVHGVALAAAPGGFELRF